MAEWKPRTKRKRWARRGPTPNELFPALSTTQLFGLLEGKFVWVPADERVAKLLDGACVGTPAGGARTAGDAAGAAAAVFGADAVAGALPGVFDDSGGGGSGPLSVCVRLSLEEALFLMHVLGTLRVVVEQEQEAQEEREEEEEEKEEATAMKTGEEEEELPPRVAREIDGDELWRYACSGFGGSDGGGRKRRSSRERAGGDVDVDNHVSTSSSSSSSSASAFLRSYVAFHHFRCKGWTVRSGLRYGCDYVLYQGHPASAHADVCVLAVSRGGGGGRGSGESLDDEKTEKKKNDDDDVKVPKGENRKKLPPKSFPASECPSRQHGPLNWLDVEIGNRLAAQVGKRLLLLHVDEGSRSPSCQSLSPLATTAAEALSRVTVEERLVERWVPDVDREELAL